MSTHRPTVKLLIMHTIARGPKKVSLTLSACRIKLSNQRNRDKSYLQVNCMSATIRDTEVMFSVFFLVLI